MVKIIIDLSRITQWANIKKWGRGSVGQFHTNHYIFKVFRFPVDQNPVTAFFIRDFIEIPFNILFISSRMTRNQILHIKLMHLSMLSWRAGEAGHRVGIWGFDNFQKFAVKFPSIIPVNCNQISPPRHAHCCLSQGWTQERHNKNISQ